MSKGPAQPSPDSWSPTKPPEMTVLADHPILHGGPKDDDQLDLVPKLAAVFDIVRNQLTQTPVAVAIYGTWGTGKSSAMRWLRDRLHQWNQSQADKQGSHAIIETVWFEPWKYQNREDVWRGLISEVILACLEFGSPPSGNVLTWIERAAKQFGTKIGRPFLAALNKINVKLKAGTGKVVPGQPELGAEVEIRGEAFQAVIDEYNKAAHPEQAYLNEFESALRTWVEDFFPQIPAAGRAPRRLAVFIDDLDRCMPGVALQVLEALKLYLNIPGLVFVVGLDRQVLDAVVRKEYEQQGVGAGKSKEYLSKMFQVEIDVAPSEEQARGFLDKQIGKLDQVTHDAWSNLLNSAAPGELDYKPIIEARIRLLGSDNPREIKRTLNSVLLRAWAAAQNETLTPGATDPQSARALRFAQGAQVFLVQKFIIRGFEQPGESLDGLLLRNDVQRWFEDWSRFVHECPELPVNQGDTTPRAPAGDAGISGLPGGRKERDPWAGAPPKAKASYDDLRRRQPRGLSLLDDPHLRELMMIPFSPIVARATPAVASERPEVALERRPGEKGVERAEAGTLEGRKPPAGPRGPSDLARLPEEARVRIAREADVPVGRLGKADLGKVTRINLSGIRELTDLAPLAGLTQLQLLALSQTGVTDLTPLAGLTQLQWLELSQTGVTDLTPLAGLTHLQSLLVSQTGVTDLTPLAGLAQLQGLYVPQTRVTDLTPLRQLKHVHIYVDKGRDLVIPPELVSRVRRQ
jgi:hypothetical protein